jgi:spermidine/putrescine transport system ATP-binding protein
VQEDKGLAPIIKLDNVEKSFADTVAVHPTTLTVEEGEFLTFLGPSGCGKTTLLRMLAGLEQPSGGDVYLEGRCVTFLPPYKRDVNLVFQSYALFPHMTVEQNILFGLKMKKLPAAEQRRRLEEVLQLTRLTELKLRYPHEISGGQQQRVAIARAIVNKPKVLLLDEPLAALDLQLRKSLQLELKQLQHRLGITFIYVTHDQEEAMSLSDRIVVMNHGRVEQTGTPEQVYRSPDSLFVATFIGENNVFRQGERLFAVRPEKIRLTAPDRPGTIKQGTVEETVFVGNMHKLWVRITPEDTLVMAYVPTENEAGLPKKSQVGMMWATEDEVTLPR